MTREIGSRVRGKLTGQQMTYQLDETMHYMKPGGSVEFLHHRKSEYKFKAKRSVNFSVILHVELVSEIRQLWSTAAHQFSEKLKVYISYLAHVVC